MVSCSVFPQYLMFSHRNMGQAIIKSSENSIWDFFFDWISLMVKCLQLSYVCGIQAHNLAPLVETYTVFLLQQHLRNVEVFFYSRGERDRL